MVVLGTIVISFNATILNIALPKIMSSLRVDVEEIRWLITGYMITMTILMPTIGWLGERFGNKRVFLGGLVIFSLTSILCGMAWSNNSLIFFRVLQGIGAGPIIPMGMVILYEAFPEDQRGLALGIYTLGMTFGPAIGPTLGGIIIQDHSWRFIFYLNVPIGIAAILLGSVVLSGTSERLKKPFDVWGIMFLSTFLVTMLVALSQGNIEGWDSSYIIGLFVAAAAAGTMFIIREIKTDDPLVELRVFKIRNFSLISIMAVINYVGMMGTFFLISIFLQRVLGFTPLRAGLFMLPTALTMGITAVLTGRLSDLVNPKYLIIGGLFMRVFAFYLFSRVNNLTTLGAIMAVLLFRSFSAAWIVTPLSTAAMRTLPPELYRHGSGLLALTRGVGGSMGIAIATTYLSYRISWNATSSLQGVDPSSLSIKEALISLDRYLAGLGESASMIHTKSILIIARKLVDHAILNAYQDTFIFLAIIFSLAIIPALFLNLPHREKGVQI